MIIGNGDIASMIEDNDHFLFFASGVSNSQETRKSEFDREYKLLDEQDWNNHVVYFSTLSLYFKKSPYTEHKAIMEYSMQNRFKNHTIIRIGNITWGKNPHTLINYLKANPEAEIQDVYRSIITPEAFKYWVRKLKYEQSEIHNLIGETLKVQEIKDRIDRGEL